MKYYYTPYVHRYTASVRRREIDFIRYLPDIIVADNVRKIPTALQYKEILIQIVMSMSCTNYSRVMGIMYFLGRTKKTYELFRYRSNVRPTTYHIINIQYNIIFTGRPTTTTYYYIIILLLFLSGITWGNIMFNFV